MIEPRYGVLQTLFADRVFRIPHYQRFYSWQSRLRQDLFSDLEKLVDQREDQHHFMATLVCYRTPETKSIGANKYSVYDIVDGQQRFGREQVSDEDGELKISIVLDGRNRFLTLVATDGGQDFSDDEVVFGDPKLILVEDSDGASR